MARPTQENRAERLETMRRNLAAKLGHLGRGGAIYHGSLSLKITSREARDLLTVIDFQLLPIDPNTGDKP